MSDKTILVKIDYDGVEVDNPNNAAILFILEKDRQDPKQSKQAWIPRSQIEEHNVEEKYFYIPEWLAVKSGLV